MNSNLNPRVARTLFAFLDRGSLLIWPKQIEQNLRRFDSQLEGPDRPNLWQLQLGAFRMLHRVLYRSETIGNCKNFPVRPRWGARAMHLRAVRLPALMALRAVAPLDFSGLASSRWRIQRHLLGAHHDGFQFVYDFELLSAHPGALAEVREKADAVVSGRSRLSEFWRDVAVFERYHENLLAAIDAFEAGTLTVDEAERDNPDLTFRAFLAWCVRQPKDAETTFAMWRAGQYTVADGVKADAMTESESRLSATTH